MPQKINNLSKSLVVRWFIFYVIMTGVSECVIVIIFLLIGELDWRESDRPSHPLL